MRTALSVIVLLALLHVCHARPRPVGCGAHCGSIQANDTSFSLPVRPGVQNCTEYWYTQTLDHFNNQEPYEGVWTFQQRYYVCDPYWRQPDGPIFFYSGNEADVTLYINNTGLMWESAPEFGALLIFAEHRYYGESAPYSGNLTNKHLQYLSSEQALADYAELIYYFKKANNCEDSAVITFGGSYGGMLSSWFRMKYPSAVDGAIAASAPIMAFAGENPESDPEAYFRIVSRDATPIARSSDACYANVQASWDFIFNLSSTSTGRSYLQDTFHLCEGPLPEEKGYDVAYWLQTAFTNYAEGDYPFPSNYLTNGYGYMPPHPMVLACNMLSDPSLKNDYTTLLPAMAEVAGIYYNASRSYQCYDIYTAVNQASATVDLLWGYQYCTELLMPISTNGVDDMFWSEPWDWEAEIAYCIEEYDVDPRPFWASVFYGGWNIEAASNIVFSNGLLDPWSGLGVKHSITESVVAVLIPPGGHHLDLYWSTINDPEAVIVARDMERMYMRQWVEQKAQRVQKKKEMLTLRIYSS